MFLVGLHRGPKLIKDIGIHGWAQERINEIELLIRICGTGYSVKGSRQGDTQKVIVVIVVWIAVLIILIARITL